MFRGIFSELFRRGYVAQYADLVFNAINTSRKFLLWRIFSPFIAENGFITFPEFVRSLSILSRGSLEERIEWVYRLYDPLKKQYVSWHNFLHILTAVNDLVEIGKRQFTPGEDVKRAQELFSVLWDKFDSWLFHFI